MGGWLYRCFDRMVAVVCAVVALQLPCFMQEYLCHLAGHYQEAKWQVMQLERAAQRTNKPLVDYVKKFLSHEDEEVQEQGQVMVQLLERRRYLEQAYDALSGSAVWSRPFYFIVYINQDLFCETYSTFQWGIHFTSDTLFYALCGIAIGCGAFWMLCRMFFLCFRRLLHLKQDTKVILGSSKAIS